MTVVGRGHGQVFEDHTTRLCPDHTYSCVNGGVCLFYAVPDGNARVFFVGVSDCGREFRARHKLYLF